LPRRLKAEIILRQGRPPRRLRHAPDHGFFVFDHRPPLGLRAEDVDANDPERLAAICWTCNHHAT
jgi:hypothetical protein